MKRRIALLLFIAAAFCVAVSPGSAYAAAAVGTANKTHTYDRSTEIVTWTWVSSGGNVTNIGFAGKLTGYIVGVEIVPIIVDSKTPPDLYDVTVTDANGVDVLFGAGLNSSNSTTNLGNYSSPVNNDGGIPFLAEAVLGLAITNAGVGKSGQVILTVKHEGPGAGAGGTPTSGGASPGAITEDYSSPVGEIPVTHSLGGGQVTYVSSTDLTFTLPGYELAGALDRCNPLTVIAYDSLSAFETLNNYETYDGSQLLMVLTSGAYGAYPAKATLEITSGQTPFSGTELAYVVLLNCSPDYNVELVDTTNITTGQHFYPGARGFSIEGMSGWSVQATISGGITVTYQISNDADDPGNWSDMTKAELNLVDNSTGSVSFVDTDHFAHNENLTGKKIRIKVVASDGSNAVELDLHVQNR